MLREHAVECMMLFLVPTQASIIQWPLSAAHVEINQIVFRSAIVPSVGTSVDTWFHAHAGTIVKVIYASTATKYGVATIKVVSINKYLIMMTHSWIKMTLDTIQKNTKN